MSSCALTVAALAVALPACGDVAAKRDVACGAQPVQVLPNGSFDAATPAWMQDPVTTALICGPPKITPVDGTQAGCLGGTDGTVQTLSQQVPLPDGAKSVTLSGQICIDTKETQAADHDVLQLDLLDGATVIAALGKMTNQQGATPCVFKALTLTAALTGDPVTATLRIRSTLDTSMPTSFYLDALSLTVSCMQ
ncbi:MAG TPA: hypothetical protein VF516_01955 [Kofleriaceae bacterium]